VFQLILHYTILRSGCINRSRPHNYCWPL